MYGLVNAGYRKKVAFIMNDATMLSFEKVGKIINGAYIGARLYQVGGNGTESWGYKVETPLVMFEAMVSLLVITVITTLVIVEADLFKRLNELFAGNGMIGFVAKDVVDGKTGASEQCRS